MLPLTPLSPVPSSIQQQIIEKQELVPHPASLKTAGRAGSTGCQRKAPLSSRCSLDSEGGEAAQSSRLCTVKSGLQLL